jgi:hypothetical protein
MSKTQTNNKKANNKNKDDIKTCPETVPCEKHEDILLSKIRQIEDGINRLVGMKNKPPLHTPPTKKTKVLLPKIKCTSKVSHPWFPSSKCKYKTKHSRRKCSHQMPSLFSYSGSYCWTKP